MGYTIANGPVLMTQYHKVYDTGIMLADGIMMAMGS